MSAWAFAERLKMRPRLVRPRSPFAVAARAAAACASLYALFCIGAEIHSGSLQAPMAILIAVTAAVVIGKHVLDRKDLAATGPPLSRTAKAAVALALLLFCCVAWIEAGRLVWWEAIETWLPNDRFILWKAASCCLVVPLLLLYDVPLPVKPRRWGMRGVDALAVSIFFIYSFNGDLPAGARAARDYGLPVFLAPVDYVRSGGYLLWDVPSQYGFLNTLLVAMLKPLKSPDAFHLVNSTCIFLGALISYFAYRLAWPALGAAVMGIPFILGISLFFPSWASVIYTAQIFPSDGPYRFLPCYLIVLLLLLQQLPGCAQKLPIRRVMLAGNGLWLIGCLWSPESLAYCSALWFPALLLLDGQRDSREASQTPWRTVLGSAKLLVQPALLLGGTLAVLSLYYLARIGHIPDFRSYFDFASAFTADNGFGTYPRVPDGTDHWLILFFISIFLIIASSVSAARRPAAACALFCSWAVSSYYVGRNHPQSILNLFPLYMLALSTTVFLLRGLPVRGEWDLFARSAARILTFTSISFVLLSLYCFELSAVGRLMQARLQALERPLTAAGRFGWNDDPEARAEKSDPSGLVKSSLKALLRKNFDSAHARCVISLEDYWHNDPENQYLWAPYLNGSTMIHTLPPEVLAKYWNRFMLRTNSGVESGACTERWLAYNDRSLEEARTELRFLAKSLRVEREIDSDGWHLLKMSAADPRDWRSLFDRGIEAANHGALDEGLDLLSASLAVNPHNPAAHFQSGYLYFLKGDVDHAIAQTQAAVALDPSMVDARNNLGFFLEKKGLYREAVAQFREALKLAPTNQLARNNLAAALSKISGR